MGTVKPRAAGAVALTIAGWLVAGCCSVSALPVTPWEAPSASLMPVVVPTPTPVPTARPERSQAPTARPEPQGEIGTAVLGGVATWYDNGSGIYAAAGPALREGNWRGRKVSVCARGNCVSVRLTDWCACGQRHGKDTLIDLSADAFRRLAPLSRGVIEVTVELP